MTGTSTPGLVPYAQTRSQGSVQSGSQLVLGAAETWVDRRGHGKACYRTGRWIQDFCNKGKVNRIRNFRRLTGHPDAPKQKQILCQPGSVWAPSSYSYQHPHCSLARDVHQSSGGKTQIL